jgi:anti-sigma factor RsiW
MTQRTWSTTEVSAYLDGQLEPRHQAALEADMEHNLALRRRVEEMQQVISLLRAEPLREPPRNYLLTTSMVAEAKPRANPSGRRAPLLVLRLATSMVTLAFVITFGLTALQGNLIPGMRASSSAVPEAAMMARDIAPENDEELSVLMMPEEPGQLEDSEAPKVEVQTERLMAPQPEAADEENDGMAMMVEEGPAPEIGEELADQASSAVEAPMPSAGSDGTGEVGAEDFTDPQRAQGMEKDAAMDAAGQVAGQSELEDDLGSPPEAAVMLQERDEGGISPWISRGLGIAAAILAAVTFWLTHHPLSRRK